VPFADQHHTGAVVPKTRQASFKLHAFLCYVAALPSCIGKRCGPFAPPNQAKKLPPYRSRPFALVGPPKCGPLAPPNQVSCPQPSRRAAVGPAKVQSGTCILYQVGLASARLSLAVEHFTSCISEDAIYTILYPFCSGRSDGFHGAVWQPIEEFYSTNPRAFFSSLGSSSGQNHTTPLSARQATWRSDEYHRRGAWLRC